MNSLKLPSVTILFVVSPALASAAVMRPYTGGHLDGPAFGYVSVAEAAAAPALSQGFEPHLHNHGGADGAIVDGVRETGETEYAPDELVTIVPEFSTTLFNSQNYYWLPQDAADAANNNVPFLGIGIEELVPTDWTGGTVTIALAGINGPGGLVIWQDGFPAPTVFFESAGDSITVPAGAHTHFNWGFSMAGDYQLDFTISGNHVADGMQSATGSYFFQVVPEPAAMVLGMTGGMLVLARRRRQ